MTHSYLIFSQCGLFNDTDSVLNTVKKTFLTERAVHPEGNKLLLSTTKELYSRLAVQRIQAANGQKYTVLYLLTGDHINLFTFNLTFCVFVFFYVHLCQNVSKLFFCCL